MKLILEIITPTQVLLKEEVDEITVTTSEGEISILPGHVNLLTKVMPGEIIIKKSGKSELLAVLGGFLEVTDDHINVLVDHAIRAQDIEIAKVQQAEERARQAMKNKTNEQEFRVAQNELGKALLELKVARKHKTRATKVS